MRNFACIFLLLCAGSTTVGEPPTTSPPAVRISPLPLPSKRVVVLSKEGQPFVKPAPGHQSESPDNPFNSDHPPYSCLKYQGVSPHGEVILRVYRITEVAQAPYKTIQPVIQKMHSLLVDQHGEKLAKTDIPIYPSPNGFRTIQTHAQYFNAAWGGGIFYITSFTSGYGEYPDNSSLYYLFGGLSKDGKYYVTAEFNITHPKLASRDYLPRLRGDRSEADSAKTEATWHKAEKILDAQPDQSFDPPLDKLKAWVSSLEIKEVETQFPFEAFERN